ncbi:MAG: hypothetical protein QXN15_09195 [Candidatus Jordarchaeales archaeon]|nr:4-vinyl reductase [Candidatus Jordarchaeia archaeon]
MSSRSKPGSALKEEYTRELHVDEWRVFWRNLRCAFIAETIPGMIYREMMNALGFLAKPYFFRFQAIPGFITVNMLVNEGYSPKEALEKYAWLHTIGGRGKAEIVEADLDKPKVVVKVYDPAITQWFRRNVKNVKTEFPFYDCSWLGYSWVGAVKAALSEGSGGSIPVTYDSGKCFALGDEYCEFHVERSEREEDPFQDLEEDYLTHSLHSKSVKSIAHASSGRMNEKIWKLIDMLEVRGDGEICIGRERILLVEGGMYSLAQMLLPVELFGGVVYGAYMRSHLDYGRFLAKQGRKYGLERVLDFFLSSASSMGWGKLELVEFEESRVVLGTYQSIYAETAKDYIAKTGLKRRPVCTYGWVVEGILNYFAEVEGKPPFVSKEEKCVAKGDNYCEFVLSRKTS